MKLKEENIIGKNPLESNNSKEHPTKEQKLKLFRQEIAEMKEKEKEQYEKGEIKKTYLQGIDPKFLGKKEMKIYKKYQEGSLSVDELKNELENVREEIKNELKISKHNFSSPNSDFYSRLDFWNFLIHKMTKRTYEAYKNSKKEYEISGKRILK